MTQKIEIEKVYGDKMIEWLYQSNSGKALSGFVSSPFASKILWSFARFKANQPKKNPTLYSKV